MNIEPTDKPQWYVLHTYSGYENKVKEAIEAAVNNRDMSDAILEIRIPMREVVEKKDGKTVVSEKKLFPGYVLVNMYLSDEVWYLIRNTRGITGFVGPEAKPIPLKDKELVRMGLTKEPEVIPEFRVGDEITVTEGPLEGFSGFIDEIMTGQAKVRVNLSMFGRPTPTELDFDQIKKIKP